MNERNKPRTESIKANKEKTSYPKWTKATAAGALAVGVAFGAHELASSTPEQQKPQDSYSVKGSVPIVVQEGESLINATYRTLDKTTPTDSMNLPSNPADILKTPLTDTQKTEIVVSAKHAEDQHGESGARLQIQPGDVYIADIGEFDGDEEVDIRVRQSTDEESSLVKSQQDEDISLMSNPETLPDYYQEK